MGDSSICTFHFFLSCPEYGFHLLQIMHYNFECFQKYLFHLLQFHPLYLLGQIENSLYSFYQVLHRTFDIIKKMLWAFSGFFPSQWHLWFASVYCTFHSRAGNGMGWYCYNTLIRFLAEAVWLWKSPRRIWRWTSSLLTPTLWRLAFPDNSGCKIHAMDLLSFLLFILQRPVV